MIPPHLALIGGLLLGATVFSAGYKVRDWQCDAAVAKAVKAAVAKERKNRAIGDAAATDYEEDREHARQANVTRETEYRTIYRDRLVRPDCAAPAAARSVLESAVERSNSRASGEPLTPVSSITISTRADD